MKWMKRIFLAVVLLVVLVAAGLALLPWKPWAEQKIIAAMAKQGISPATLHLESVGLSGLTFTNVTLGEPPLKLANLTVGYQPRALLRGQIEAVTLSGLVLEATQGEAGWAITGLDALKKPAPSSAAAPTIPTSRAGLAAVPLTRMAIADSHLRATGKGWQAELPITANYAAAGTISLQVKSAGISASKGPDALSTGAVSFDFTLDEAKQQWAGKWSIADITVTSESIALPKLKAMGDLKLTADSITLTGNITDASKAYNTAFTVNYSLSKPETSLAVISALSLPWGGGTIGASKVQLPLGGKKSTTLTLNVKQVPIVSLLKLLTNDTATATGVVSGTLPLTITAEGNITPGKGSLKSEEPGTISMPPDTIPGDNQQVTLVRDVLKNLHYTLLSLDLDTEDDKTLSVTLAVEGNNPDVEKGRPVKLKVHLSGDLLNLITQNLKLMTDPTQFIQQESSHEKN